MGSVPDLLASGLKVIFIGFNPSIKSGETGHHYAGRGNRLWKLLYDAGLTGRLYSSSQDADLLDEGFGFTNIVERPTQRADELTRDEYKQGGQRLGYLLKRYRPEIACYVGKGVYEQFSGRKDVPWGLQPQSVVPGVTDFVAPSSSGLVRIPYGDVLEIYRSLKNLINGD